MLITFSGAQHDGVTYISAFGPDDIILNYSFNINCFQSRI